MSAAPPAAAANAVAGPYTVVLAGATGRVGINLLKKLVQAGYRVKALVRDEKKGEAAFRAAIPDENHRARIDIIKGDVKNAESLKAAFATAKGDDSKGKGIDAVVSAVGASGFFFGDDTPDEINNRGVCNLVDATKHAGIGSFVLLSSVSVTKWYSFISILGLGKQIVAGEQHLRSSGLRYTIVRPPRFTSGDAGGSFWFRQGDTLPMIGPKMARLNVAEAVFQATRQTLLRRNEPANKVRYTFEVSETYSVPEKPDAGSYYARDSTSTPQWDDVFSKFQLDV